MTHQTILDFWFEEIDPSKWWVKDLEFDDVIRQRFSNTHRQASACELNEWRKTAKGRLAEIIVLDQFSRNLFRDSAAAFTCDPLALALAQEAISLGLDNQLSETERNFIYMPFMHSESLRIHEMAVELYETKGSTSSLEFERKHKVIIERFGRYPHRNALLGRQSSEAEIEFLTQPGSSF